MTINLQTLLNDIDTIKKHVDAQRPLNEEALAKLYEYLDVEYTYNSNAIEGNTLSRMETMLVLKHGQTIGGKPLKDHLEAVNHQQAIFYIRDIFSKVEPITERDVKYLHSLILKSINDRYAGNYRDIEIYISGSKTELPKPAEVPTQMAEFSQWLVDRQENQDLHPVILAAQAHYRLVKIHPFVDGNGRVSRLLMNLILLKYGYFIAIVDNDQREDYYRALQAADQGDLSLFENIIAGYVKATAGKYLGIIPS